MTVEKKTWTEQEAHIAFVEHCKSENWPVARKGDSYAYPMQKAAFRAFVAGLVAAGGQLL